MRVVVYRRPARVHFHFARAQRNERFRLPTQRVVQSKFVHDHPSALFGENKPQIVAEHQQPQQSVIATFAFL